MCALFAKIVALLAKQFAKRTGCDRRRLWQIDQWIKEITLTMSIGRPARGRMDSQLTQYWGPTLYNVGCQQAHPLDGWLLIGLLHWSDPGRFHLQWFRLRFQHTFSIPIPTPVILVTIPTPIPTPNTIFMNDSDSDSDSNSDSIPTPALLIFWLWLQNYI